MKTLLLISLFSILLSAEVQYRPIVEGDAVIPVEHIVKRDDISNEIPVPEFLRHAALCRATIGGEDIYGIDGGEFGGGVCVVKRGILTWLSKDPVRSIFGMYDSLYVISGISHLSQEYGCIYKIEKPDSVVFKSYLPQAPIATCLGSTSEGRAIYVVTKGLVYTVEDIGGNIVVTILVKDDGIGQLAPNSCIWHNGHLYFGGLGGIFTVEGDRILALGARIRK